SERNCGARATVEPSRSIVWQNGFQFRRPTKTILCGSSFVATRAPKRLAGIFRPRPLIQGTAQAMVSPRRFCFAKIGARREGNAIGKVGLRWKSGAALSLFSASQIFAFIERKI